MFSAWDAALSLRSMLLVTALMGAFLYEHGPCRESALAKKAIIAAVFVNTSRASMAIGILIMATLAVGGTMVAIRRAETIASRPQVLATVGVVFVCAVILALSFGIEGALAWWNNTLDFLFASEGELWAGRVSIYRICWLSLYAAGWFGFGPWHILNYVSLP